MAGRRAVPKAVRDKLLVEAMHRCCLCPEHHDVTDLHHPTLTSTPDNVATAIQGASIFAAPCAADSQQLGGVSAGEQVTVLGRSEHGSWFYIRDDQSVEGFVYAPRFEWAGDYESLPIVPSSVTCPTATATPTIPPTPLELELWPLDGYCAAGVSHRNVYMGARGDNGVFTYYWNDELKCGPLTNESCTFVVYSQRGSHRCWQGGLGGRTGDREGPLRPSGQLPLVAGIVGEPKVSRWSSVGLRHSGLKCRVRERSRRAWR
ncbi:MAG: SH3 domain-containing protein [Anaerolineae bacterium]